MEAALDNDNPGQNSTFKITGGEVIGIGGTVYSPSSSSTQYTIVYNGCPVSTTAELAVNDSEGNKILAITSPQGSQSSGVLLSSPKFIKGGTYTISIGDTTYQTVTLSSIILFSTRLRHKNLELNKFPLPNCTIPRLCES